MTRRFHIAECAVLILALSRPGAGIAQTGGEVTLPRISLPMAATSYPMESLARNEEGTIVFDLAIGVDGAVTNAEIVESTGYPLLDDLALRVIRNVRLPTPPMAPDGTPTTGRALADIVWTLPLESAEMYMQPDPDGEAPIVDGGEASQECRSAPGITRDARRQRRLSEGGVPIYERYMLVNEEGIIEDSLLLTDQGWMRLGAEHLAALNRRADYGAAISVPNGPRPSTCWLYEETTW